MNSLSSIILPDDIWWQDELDWTPINRSMEISTTGSVLIDEDEQQEGRPITLVGGEDFAWITRETALGLQALASTLAAELSLEINGQTFTVRFNPKEKKPVDVAPLIRISPPAAADTYIINGIRLITTS